MDIPKGRCSEIGGSNMHQFILPVGSDEQSTAFLLVLGGRSGTATVKQTTSIQRSFSAALLRMRLVLSVSNNWKSHSFEIWFRWVPSLGIRAPTSGFTRLDDKSLMGIERINQPVADGSCWRVGMSWLSWFTNKWNCEPLMCSTNVSWIVIDDHEPAINIYYSRLCLVYCIVP